MKPELRRIGTGASPLMVIDDFSGDAAAIVDIAAALAPFPRAQTHYPGLRRTIGPHDDAAKAYVTRTLKAAAPFIGGAFGAASFELIDASFSIVTDAPDALRPGQRIPHFDSTDPAYLAILHYLSDTPGTAFYRHRATGIEAVSEAHRAAFLAAAASDAAAARGYIAASNAGFERIAEVAGRSDRLIIYQGRLLHSGIIPEGMPLSADPRVGRLTANLFVRIA